MSVLVDHDIAERVHYGDLEIDPYDEDNLQPASYDLTLGREFVAHQGPGSFVQTVDTGPKGNRDRIESDEYIVNPGEFVLGHTVEVIGLPADLTAEVKGRSSIGRLGLIPHTAGWIDPGFRGQITLEFVNHGNQHVKLEAGMRIAQIVFTETSTRASTPYGEKSDQKYQGQSGATESRLQEDQ